MGAAIYNAETQTRIVNIIYTIHVTRLMILATDVMSAQDLGLRTS